VESSNCQDSSTDTESSTSSQSASELSDVEEDYIGISNKPSVLSPYATVIAAKTCTYIRATAGLLNSAAEKLGVPEAKQSKSSVHYNNIKTRKSMMDESLIKFRNATFH